jgi:hypothetical protein
VIGAAMAEFDFTARHSDPGQMHSKLPSPERTFSAPARSKLRRIRQISHTVAAYTVSFPGLFPAFHATILAIHRLFADFYPFLEAKSDSPAAWTQFGTELATIR